MTHSFFSKGEERPVCTPCGEFSIYISLRMLLMNTHVQNKFPFGKETTKINVSHQL